MEKTVTEIHSLTSDDRTKLSIIWILVDFWATKNHRRRSQLCWPIIHGGQWSPSGQSWRPCCLALLVSALTPARRYVPFSPFVHLNRIPPTVLSLRHSQLPLTVYNTIKCGVLKFDLVLRGISPQLIHFLSWPVSLYSARLFTLNLPDVARFLDNFPIFGASDNEL